MKSGTNNKTVIVEFMIKNAPKKKTKFGTEKEILKKLLLKKYSIKI